MREIHVRTLTYVNINSIPHSPLVDGDVPVAPEPRDGRGVPPGSQRADKDKYRPKNTKQASRQATQNKWKSIKTKGLPVAVELAIAKAKQLATDVEPAVKEEIKKKDP